MKAATEESWYLLAELSKQGKLNCLYTTKVSVREAKEEHLRQVWKATGDYWFDLDAKSKIARCIEAEADSEVSRKCWLIRRKQISFI